MAIIDKYINQYHNQQKGFNDQQIQNLPEKKLQIPEKEHQFRTMSKTQHYRKVTKPLLERKRRARMNQYLEELKELIVETMEAQGEHVSKLEKADILELTVTYLKDRKEHSAVPERKEKLDEEAEKFRAGYTRAAYEVSKIFATIPGIDTDFGTRLMKHLGYQFKNFHSSFVDGVQQKVKKEIHPNQRENDNLQFHPISIICKNQNDQQNEKIQQEQGVWRPWSK